MCRKNVKIKLLLMKRYVSYWDLLPEQIQVLILKYKDSQALVYKRQSAASKSMCRQIREYGQLRLKCMLGHIECSLRKCIVGVCIEYCYCERMRIFGHYRDLRGEKQRVFLGLISRRAWIIVN